MTTETNLNTNPAIAMDTQAEQALKAREMQDGSICIFIKTKRLTTRRAVEQEAVEVASTEDTPGESSIDQDSVVVSKDILKSKELKAIQAYDHATRKWFRQRSVPSPILKSSAYCFATSALPVMYEYLESRFENRKTLIEALVAALPALKAQAEKDLGALYDATQYPASDDAARDLFDFTWQVVEISSPNKKMRSVSQVIFEKEQKKAEQAMISAVGQIEQALAGAFAEVVKHLGSQLGGGTEKKRIRQESFQKVLDFIESFPQRNIGGSADMAKLVEEAKDLVKGIDVKDVRKDEDLRARLAEGVAKVTKTLDTMMENKPSRAISVSDDEEV